MLYAHFGRATCLRCACSLRLSGLRWSSTDTPAPPLLAKIKGDLKSAMRNKDTNRLNVLRAIITETNNASKTSSPVETDMQVLAMLRKKKSASQAAAVEFADAKREDLQQKQEAEIKVLDEYAGQVKVMSEADVSQAVDTAVQKRRDAGDKVQLGMVLKDLVGPGGSLDGKPVDKGDLAKIVQERLKT